MNKTKVNRKCKIYKVFLYSNNLQTEIRKYKFGMCVGDYLMIYLKTRDNIFKNSNKISRNIIKYIMVNKNNKYNILF